MRTNGLLTCIVLAASLRSTAQMVHQGMGMSTAAAGAEQRQAIPCDMENMASDNKRDTEAISFIDLLQQRETSGTDAEPASTPHEMLMGEKAGWMLMLHGEIFITDVQQTGPRGRDKLFSTNWIMPMARRKLGNGVVTFRTMLSLEPATISHRRYPELFQQGETAFGRPIVDGQHPHDFFMEVAALYDYKLGENTMLSFYAAAMGDPAMGPLAYPHRTSASENPMATLGHHLQDSTHILDDVITVGLTHKNLRIEASGFHGREPDEYRWDLDSGKIDSWSSRVTVNPARNWSGQFSIGQLHSPEALVPAENLRRMTGSVMYNRPIRDGNWASLLLWGRNQSLSDGNVGNGYLLESSLRFHNINNAWTRIESADRTNELLVGENPLPTNFTEKYFTRVQSYTAGYDREVGRIAHVSTAIGGQATWYGVPDVLRPSYGDHPVAAAFFVRARLH
jgi:hypothetical protein